MAQIEEGKVNSSLRLEYRGVNMHLKQYAYIVGVAYDVVKRRHEQQKEKPYKELVTPKDNRSYRLQEGEYLSIVEISTRFGVPKPTLYARIKKYYTGYNLLELVVSPEDLRLKYNSSGKKYKGQHYFKEGRPNSETTDIKRTKQAQLSYDSDLYLKRVIAADRKQGYTDEQIISRRKEKFY